MSDLITPAQFHAADGVDDWRVLALGATAHFDTGTFAQGVELVGRIGALGDAAPDVDVRPDGVTVRLLGGPDGLPAAHVNLARRISAAARALGARADPAAAQDVELTIDALDTTAVRPFWCAVLGYREVGDDDALDPRRIGPLIWFQDMDAPREQRNRMHVDVFVPHDQAEARVAAAVAAGGRVVSDTDAPSWWVLADPEGNEVCVATRVGRD